MPLLTPNKTDQRVIKTRMMSVATPVRLTQMARATRLERTASSYNQDVKYQVGRAKPKKKMDKVRLNLLSNNGHA